MHSKEGRRTSGKRVEDLRFLTGSSIFTDDIKRKNSAFLGIIRSAYAHAIIEKVDFSGAKSNPDFIDYLTGRNLVQLGVAPLFEVPGQQPTKRYHLAVEKTRYVGEPVAAFIVRSRYAIEDVAEQVSVSYHQLPVVRTLDESRNAKATLYDEWGENAAFVKRIRKGEISKNSATKVIKASLAIKRQAGTPIEPRSLVAAYNRSNNSYEVWASVQSAHNLRRYLSSELKTQPEKVRVVVKDVGGSFGTKGAQSYPEVLLACLFAKKTGYDIKWTSTRTEDLLETAQGRDERCDIELGTDSTGKILALRARVEADIGVSGTFSGAILNTLALMPNVYRIPNIDLEGVCYVTNKTPTGPVRGNGRPEGIFFMERAIDIMAKQLAMDPVEFRRRNLVQPSDFPYDNGAMCSYDSGNFPLLLETLVEQSDYERLKKWKQTINKRRRQNKQLAGIGIAMEVEDTGKMSETAKIVAGSDGMVTVFTGSSPHGQGLETTLAQLCSRELGVPLRQIKVVWGDTNLIPSGVGTFGSRSATIGGSAVAKASRDLKHKVIQVASQSIERNHGDIDLKGGNIIGNDGKVIMSLSELVEDVGSLEAESDFSLESVPYASGAHLCALLVDTETGKVRIKKYVGVDDCGTVINESIVEGQIHGGVVHGIGGALFEELVYDLECQLINSNFLNYTIPTADDVPDIEVAHFVTPSPLSFNGAKGVGESGTIAACAAVFNALNNALSEINVELNIAPATPESVFAAVNEAA